MQRRRRLYGFYNDSEVRHEPYARLVQPELDWNGAGARCHDTAYNTGGESKVFGGQANGDGFEYYEKSSMAVATTHACGTRTTRKQDARESSVTTRCMICGHSRGDEPSEMPRVLRRWSCPA